jgi:hypothetical protein
MTHSRYAPAARTGAIRVRGAARSLGGSRLEGSAGGRRNGEQQTGTSRSPKGDGRVHGCERCPPVPPLGGVQGQDFALLPSGQP